MSDDSVFILSAVRLPIGGFLGALSSFSATDLGAMAIETAVKRAGIDPKSIEQVYMGEVLTAGVGQAPARQAALKAGLPSSVTCTTVGKVCGSGLKAVSIAAQNIQTQTAQAVVCGGMESMSQSPFLLSKMREGQKLGNTELVDSMVNDGLWDSFSQTHMGQIAEKCVKKYAFSREAQDAFAKASYEKAIAAIESGAFDAEMVSVEKKLKNETILVSKDEDPFKAKFDKFSSLKPSFEKDGTITPANASNLNDGAAALVLASKAFVMQNKLNSLAQVVGFCEVALEPEWFTVAPVKAIERLLEKNKWDAGSVDLFEINEAFSAVTMAAIEELKLDPKKVNIHGGAVALGHPIGASGARILTTLIHALKKHKLKRGIATLCIGGGEAIAMGVEV